MIITNLKPETTYSITVAAYTMKGDGARSKPKVVVTKGAGTRPPPPMAPRPPQCLRRVIAPVWGEGGLGRGNSRAKGWRCSGGHLGPSQVRPHLSLITLFLSSHLVPARCR